jgi:hypothetical protein
VKTQPGQVSCLPTFNGDGYGYGGGIVVTFGDIAIQLGETSPNDQSRLELARLITAAPALVEALTSAAVMLEAIEAHCVNERGLRGADHAEDGRRVRAAAQALMPELRAALSLATGEGVKS